MGNKILKNLSISLVLFLCLCTLISCKKTNDTITSSENSSFFKTANSNSDDLGLQSDNNNKARSDTTTSNDDKTDKKSSSKIEESNIQNNTINDSTTKSTNDNYELCDLDSYHQVYTKLYVICFKIKKNGKYICANGSADLVYTDSLGKELFNGNIEFTKDSDIFSYDESTSFNFITFEENLFSVTPKNVKITIKCGNHIFEQKTLKVDSSNSSKSESSQASFNIKLPSLPLTIESEKYSTVKITEIISGSGYFFEIHGEILKKRNYAIITCFLYNEDGFVNIGYCDCSDIPAGSKFKKIVHFSDANINYGKKYRFEMRYE